MRARILSLVGAAALLVVLPAHAATTRWSVGYQTPAALRGLDVVSTVPALRIAEVRGPVRHGPGIRFVQRLTSRSAAVDPAVLPLAGAPLEWQFDAVHESGVPDWVLRAAAGITIAVVDTGADLSAPDLAAKAPAAYNVRTGTANVRDTNGHGTFVAALAVGSVTNGEGIAGFGGDARLLVVKAGANDGSFTDVDEAAGIVYAVDHGARIVNLSLGGRRTSRVEKDAISYAVARGALVVAAAGNEVGAAAQKPEYPAALLQPPGSQGRGGVGLAVAASTQAGLRADFSNAGSYVSLAAPGEDVFGALSSLSQPDEYPRVPLPGSRGGLYGFASGTSFAAPEVAGAAALVWAANPLLTASEVADVLKETASAPGWNPQLGYGVIDVSAAVAVASGRPALQLSGTRDPFGVRLRWRVHGAATAFAVAASVDGAAPQVVAGPTTLRTASLYLAGDHDYVFTVQALDAAGKVTGASPPYRLSLR